MSLFNCDLIQALRERQTDNTDPAGNALTFTWAGKAFPCCAGDAKFAKSLGVGGFGLDSNLLLIIITEDIVPGFQTAADLNGKLPAMGQKGVYQSYQWKIGNVALAPGLAFIALALIDPAKGL